MANFSIFVNQTEKELLEIPSLKVLNNQNFYVSIIISGTPGCTNSTLTLMSYSRKESGVLIATKQNWQKKTMEKSTKFLNKSNFNFCSIKDLESVIEVTITAIEEGFNGECKISYGPIKLDPNISRKFELLKYEPFFRISVIANFNFEDKKLETVEINEIRIVGFDNNLNEVGGLNISNDLLLIFVPNSNKQIKLFNSEKKELNIEFEKEDEKDLFMLLFEFWKTKKTKENRKLNDSKNSVFRDINLFANLEKIENKNSFNFKKMSTEVIDFQQDSIAEVSEASLCEYFPNEPIESSNKEIHKPYLDYFKSPEEKDLIHELSLNNSGQNPFAKKNTSGIIEINKRNMTLKELLQSSDNLKDNEILDDIKKNDETFENTKKKENKIKNKSKKEDEIYLKNTPEILTNSYNKNWSRNLHNKSKQNEVEFRSKVLFQSLIKKSQQNSFMRDTILQTPKRIGDKELINTLKRSEKIEKDQVNNESNFAKQTVRNSATIFRKLDQNLISKKSLVLNNSELNLKNNHDFEKKLMTEILEENMMLDKLNKDLESQVATNNKKYENLESEFHKMVLEKNDTIYSENNAKKIQIIEEKIINDLEKKKTHLEIKENELNTKQNKIKDIENYKKKMTREILELKFQVNKKEKENLKLKNLNTDNIIKIKITENQNQKLKNELEKKEQKENLKFSQEKSNEIEIKFEFEHEKKVLNKIVEETLEKIKQKEEIICDLKLKLSKVQNEFQRNLNSTIRKNESQNSYVSKQNSQVTAMHILDKYENANTKLIELKASFKKSEEQNKNLENKNNNLNFEIDLLRKNNKQFSVNSNRNLSEKVTILSFEKNQLENDLIFIKKLLKMKDNQIDDFLNEKNNEKIEKEKLESNFFLKIGETELEIIKKNDVINTLIIEINELKEAGKKESKLENKLEKDLTGILSELLKSKIKLNNKIISQETSKIINQILGDLSSQNNQIVANLPIDIKPGMESNNILDFSLFLNEHLKMSSNALKIIKKESDNLPNKLQERRIKEGSLSKDSPSSEKTSNKNKLKIEKLNNAIKKNGQNIGKSKTTLLKGQISTKNLSNPDEFFSFSEKENEKEKSIKLSESFSEKIVDMEELLQFLRELFGILAISNVEVNQNTIQEKYSIIKKGFESLISENRNFKAEIVILNSKIQELTEEIDYINLKLEEVKTKRKQLIEFVKEQMLKPEEN